MSSAKRRLICRGFCVLSNTKVNIIAIPWGLNGGTIYRLIKLFNIEDKSQKRSTSAFCQY